MIPSSRPVRYTDIRMLQHVLSETKADTLLTVGLQPGELRRLEKGDKQMDLAVAMTTRVLMEMGDVVSPLRRTPTLVEFCELLESIDPIWKTEPQRIPVLLGRDRTAIFRWRKRADAAMALPTGIRRWMQTIWYTLHDTQRVDQRAYQRRILKRLWDMMIAENAMRGYDPDALRTRYAHVLVDDAATKKRDNRSRTGAKLGVDRQPGKAGPVKTAKTAAKPAKKRTRP